MVANHYEQKRSAFLQLSHDEKKRICIDGLRMIKGRPTIDRILGILESGMDATDEQLLAIYEAILAGEHASSEAEAAAARTRFEAAKDVLVVAREREEAERASDRASSEAAIAVVMM